MKLTEMDKVLVIDDDVDILDVLQVILERDGIVMKGMSNAKGLEEELREKPCMILLDVHLKGADGRDVCERLKSDPETKDIPVVMFSASSPQNLKLTCKPDEFIEKPFDIHQLVSVIRRYCREAVRNG